MSYVTELDRALTTARIPRARRERILAEVEDHLACDSSAAERLGDPAQLAARFADEVGTALARRTGFVAFLALVPFGVLFAALFALAQPANVPILLGTQLAFVGGMLAVLRAWRLRGARTALAAEARVVRRRAGLALAGTALTVGGLAAEGAAFPLTVAAVGTVSFIVAAVALAHASRLQPVAAGPATATLATDLGRDESPWRLALVVAAAVAVCIAANGVVQSDPFDGAAAGLLDALLCLGGFAALGRWLGLR